MAGLKLGSVFGIGVELHPTFVWLFAALAGVLLVFLFVSVFVHELFHSLVALSKHVRVEKIVLLPIGGISMAEEMPEKPLDEFLVAIAGPLFNFLVVFLILFLVAVVPGLPWPHALFSGQADYALVEEAMLAYPLFALLWVNLMLGAFNLFVPALPMDGGRVLRALLSMVMCHAKATALASKISLGFAFLMALLGLLGGSLMLVVIAVFLYFGATYERDLTAMKETIRGADYGKIVSKKFSAVDEGMRFEDALKAIAEKNTGLLLVKGGTGIGYLSTDDLLA